MKILVIGLGSMGRRRIRLLCQYWEKYEIVGVDLNSDRCNIVEKEFGIHTSTNLEEVLKKIYFKCAFIASSPLSHDKLIRVCLTNGLHVFSELNLVSDGYAKNIDLAKRNNLHLFLSSTMLYREEINYIMDVVKNSDEKLNYCYHIGQYLPDWHPWEDYRDYFISNSRTNGCREIMAIEFPWLLLTFGSIIELHVEKGKNSILEGDYNDHYMITTTHTSGHKGMFMIDVLSRKAERSFKLIGEEHYIQWDGTPETLQVFDVESNRMVKISSSDKIERTTGYNEFVVENAYYNEMGRFFEILEGRSEYVYTFEEDLETLQLIDEIEK